MKTQFAKIAMAASLTAALAFTLSCSSDNGDDNGSDGSGNRKGSREIVESYALKGITDNSFTFTYIDTISGSDYCGAFGVLKREAEVHDVTVNYIINNGILVWQDYYHNEDSLQFNGTSNNLAGTWTRKVNDYGLFKNVTKVEFIGNELKITYDYCAPDRIFFRYGEDRGKGWKIRNINCETYEIYKENKVITVKETSRLDVISELNVTYNGKVCGVPASQHEKACQDAWKFLQATVEDITELMPEQLEILLEELSRSYTEQVEEEFSECLANMIPYTEVSGGYKGFLWGF